MLTCTAAWRERVLEWLPEEAIPTRSDLGTRYPWRALCAHSMTRQHRRRIDLARRAVGGRVDIDPESLGWYAAISGGKDSMVMAHLLASMGLPLPAMCALRPAVDFPAKDRYVLASMREMGHDVALLYPDRDDDPLAELAEAGVDLDGCPYEIGWEMAERGLWGSISEWLAVHDYAGCFLGLRAGESRGRMMNRRLRGTSYLRRDGMSICTPLADWTAQDVHAYLLAHDIPPLPLYLCVDPGDNGMMLREDSILTGGAAAAIGGAYAWLRRWWPEEWGRVAAADSRVSTLG